MVIDDLRKLCYFISKKICNIILSVSVSSCSRFKNIVPSKVIELISLKYFKLVSMCMNIL